MIVHVITKDNLMNIKRLGLWYQLQDLWKISFYLLLITIIIIIYVFSSRSSMYGGILFGGVSGVLGHFRMTWVSIIRVPIKNNVSTEIGNWFYSIGYNDNMDNLLEPKSPRLLRFNAQNISLKIIANGNMEIMGPYYILKRFRKWERMGSVLAS